MQLHEHNFRETTKPKLSIIINSLAINEADLVPFKTSCLLLVNAANEQVNMIVGVFMLCFDSGWRLSAGLEGTGWCLDERGCGVCGQQRRSDSRVRRHHSVWSMHYFHQHVISATLIWVAIDVHIVHPNTLHAHYFPRLKYSQSSEKL